MSSSTLAPSFDQIHNKSDASAIFGDTHLRVAAETVGVLSYLHSAASIPIIHRDVKSANILLDDNYIAIVSHFGASRLVSLNVTQLSTMVQGALGYLDPKYFHTNQLIEKNDVYSSGVILVELLTGKKTLSFDRPDKVTSLATYFLSLLKEDRWLEVLEDHLVCEGNSEQLKEVAEIARRCLNLKGEERPTMKEVAMELDGLRIEKHPWVDIALNLEDLSPFLVRHLMPMNMVVVVLQMQSLIARGNMQYCLSMVGDDCFVHSDETTSEPVWTLTWQNYLQTNLSPFLLCNCYGDQLSEY